MTDVAARRDTRALFFMHYGALVYAGGSFLLAAFMIYGVLSSAISGDGSGITLPVGSISAAQFDLLGVDPVYSDARFTEVEFTASNLSFGASMLYYAPRALTPLAHGIVAISIMVLVSQVRAGRPFSRGVVRGFLVSAVTIAVIGTLNQILAGYGVSLTRWELLRNTQLLGGYVSPQPFDWAPIFISCALVVVARVFTIGSALQRDNAGLV